MNSVFHRISVLLLLENFLLNRIVVHELFHEYAVQKNQIDDKNDTETTDKKQI